MKVALATCVKLPEPDVDERLLVSALEARGARVRMLPWDASVTASSDELVVIRSTWNYFENVDGFLSWTRRTSAAARLLNPAAIVEQNARKTYLRDLERRGIDVVPTEWVTKSTPRRVEDVTSERGWSAIVIKPVVSAASFLTQRFDASDTRAAQRFLDEVTAQRDAMIQRWMPSVETYGERSLVWIDGELTHAIRKSPRFFGDDEAVSPEVPISARERAFADRILGDVRERLPHDRPEQDLLYARVDMVEDEEGTLRLMELELIEPSLFLKQCPRALDRLAAAIVARASA